MITRKRKWILAILTLLLIVGFVAFLLTRQAERSALTNGDHAAIAPRQKLVDEGPLQTANSLLTVPSTTEEQQIAEEAYRIADNEVDLAFASALQQAQNNRPPQSDTIKQLSDRLHLLEPRLQPLQQEVNRLTKLAGASGNNDIGQRQLEVAQAKLTLLQDAIVDARQDLLRAGGDPQAEIKQELEQHEAVHHGKPILSASKPASITIEGNLLAQFQEWQRLRENQRRLLRAQQEASTAVQVLTRKHQALEKGLPDTLDALGDTSETAVPMDEAQQNTALTNLQNLSAKNKALADYDKRIQAERQLARLYGQWVGILDLQLRAALHAILRSLLWILLALIGIVVAEGLVERFYVSLGPDHRRLGTMRLVLRFVSQAIGVLVILVVLFGSPTQLSTVLALAGAGLTVALKDFIVAFFGWFILMGRHGIRRGDWVEINGIGGEVVEVGLLRTILLETGNWNDAGHPTGRKVSFVNSFAIEGHYFNFTTAGQWLWDELDVLIPSGDDPYRLTNSVLKLVSEQTREDASRAEQELHRVGHPSAGQGFSASPAVNLRPTNLGVNLVVRYVVNAQNRYPVRTRLYQEIVELLHGKKASGVAEPAAPART